MESFEIMEARHSVRQYKDQAIEPEKRAELERLTEALNRQYGLHMPVSYTHLDVYKRQGPVFRQYKRR